MKIQTNFVQFCNLALSNLQFSKKKFGIILDSFKLRKFQTCNVIAMAKDLKSQYWGYLIRVISVVF